MPHWLLARSRKGTSAAKTGSSPLNANSPLNSGDSLKPVTRSLGPVCGLMLAAAAAADAEKEEEAYQNLDTTERKHKQRLAEPEA